MMVSRSAGQCQPLEEGLVSLTLAWVVSGTALTAAAAVEVAVVLFTASVSAPPKNLSPTPSSSRKVSTQRYKRSLTISASLAPRVPTQERRSGCDGESMNDLARAWRERNTSGGRRTELYRVEMAGRVGFLVLGRGELGVILVAGMVVVMVEGDGSG